MSAPSRKVSLIVSEQAENPDRKSFEDSVLSKVPPSISPDRRGSVPLFGSLIYYRSQSLDPTILSKTKIDDDTNGTQLRSSTNRNRRSFSYSHDEQGQMQNISNQLKKYRLSSAEPPHQNNDKCNDKTTTLEPQVPVSVGSETSDSIISIYEPTTPTHSITGNNIAGVIEDPFNVIDAKIESQRRQSFHWFDDTLEKNKGTNKSRNKDKNKNKISNLDSDTVRNENPNNKLGSLEIVRDKSTSSINSQDSKEEDPDKFDTPLKGKSPPRQNRHRRRLTCAMIFTKPKFVDV